MSSSFTGGEKLKRRLQELNQKCGGKRHVKVGFFDGATYEDGTSVVQVAAAQEYGTATIPARPFMRTTVAERGDQWPRALASLLQGTGMDMDAALKVMGSQITSEVKDTIASIADPPLSEATIAARLRAKPDRSTQTLDKPLEDSLTMIGNVKYQVEDD